MSNISALKKKRTFSESGQTLTEYAFIFLLITLVVVAFVSTFGQNLSDLYQPVVSAF